ncbi:hypothetical protein GSD1FS_1478 [Bifidobacterium sp. GSD1FS]|uniref:Uncharacterized protein n=1 Tax=Bifidobacterium canis TaxID=2610880 RepID=A0A7K1J658_9BIFI|nr:hypothetical protein [Bifidobacterium canis]
MDQRYIISTQFKGRGSLTTIETEEEQNYYLNSKNFDQYIASLTKRFEDELAKN